MNVLKSHRPVLGPAQFVIVSFAAAIVLGTGLLMLPIASRGNALSVVDALFTATSAVCVTGLIVVDTGSHFTAFGQGVILCLIQIGGLGIVTFSTLIFYRLTGRMSIRDRESVLGTVGGTYPVRLAAFLKAIFLIAFVIEFLGAVFLAVCFSRTHALPEAIYLGVFHAVSAFCNAGFSLFADSLMAYQTDVFVNGIAMFLIVTGGLGFPVLMEIGRALKDKKGVSSLSLHTKIALFVSGTLILTGAFLFFAAERNNSLLGLPFGSQVLGACFQSVTARTAGFNTVDFGQLIHVALFLIILLMFIGGGSGSCAGGVKVTSFCILASLAWRHLHGRTDLNLYGRRIPEITINRALAVFGLSLLLVTGILILLLISESETLSLGGSRAPFLELLFETVSAFGTVGLSTGITPNLTPIGRVLITLLMFVGRVGPLSLVALIHLEKPSMLRYPEENVMVG